MPYLWRGWRLGLSLLSRRDGDPGDEVGKQADAGEQQRDHDDPDSDRIDIEVVGEPATYTAEHSILPAAPQSRRLRGRRRAIVLALMIGRLGVRLPVSHSCSPPAGSEASADA